MVPTPDAKNKLGEPAPGRAQTVAEGYYDVAKGPRVMSALNLDAREPLTPPKKPEDLVAKAADRGPETGDRLPDAEPSPAKTDLAQQPVALSAPSLNSIIEQAVGNAPGAAAAGGGLGLPDFLTPGTSSISGIFGSVALGGLAGAGLGGGSAGILSGIASSSSALSGRLVNGYISGARVYQDQDGDGVYDAGEPSATTAADGSYELTIVSGGGSLIAEPLAGTVDMSTGATVTSQFSAPSGATVISPVSTLVDAGLSESQVKTALGIDSSIDILNFDPVSETLYGDDPDKALGFKSASVLVSNLLDVGSEVIGGAAGSTDNFSDQVVSGIVGLIQESGSSAVDLADADTIGSALTKAATAAQTDGVAIDPTASTFSDTVDGMKTQIASANAAVKTALADNAGDPEAALLEIARVEAATQTSLASKARAVAKGDETVDSLSSFDLNGAISSASVPDVIQALASAATPGRGESGVSSVYSDTYTSASTPAWSVSAGAIDDTVIVAGSGDTAKKITGADSVTITLPGTFDASEMSTLHVSVWRSKPAADLTVSVVDYGADTATGGGDDTQHVVTYNAANDNKIGGGQWVDLEINLTDLTDLSSTANIGEIVISSQTDGAASGETLYLDNIYFSKVFRGFTFDEPEWTTTGSGWTINGSEGAFIPDWGDIRQSDDNNLLGLFKGGLYSHVIIGTGTNNEQSIIDPVDLETNPVLGMWVHAEQAGSEIRIQLGDSATGGWPNDQLYTEASATTTQAGWNFLTFDFNNPAERFVANGATNGSQGYTAATKFDPDTTYDMMSIFPDLSVEAAIGRSYYFDTLAPFTGTVPDEPLAIEGTDTGGGDSQPDFTGLDFEGTASDYNLLGFQGAEDQVSLTADPEDPSNTVIQFTKTTDAYYYAGVQLGIGDTETVGPISFDIASDQTAISARIWTPEAGKIARMEIGDSIFGGVVDMNFVHAEAELTQAGWNDVIFDFSQPVERWVTSYGRNEYIALNDSVTYDRISVFIDWENGKGATALTSDTSYYIDDISGPGEGLSGGYTVPDGYVLSFEDNFDHIGQAPDPTHWTLETGDHGWGNQELQNYTDSTDNAVIVDVGVTGGDTDRTDDGKNGALKITAKRDGNEITSARVKSDIDDLPAYGYYEIRAKLPSESGAWPAIWLLGDLDDGGWPATGEIDMVEWSSKYFSEADGDTIIHALHMTDRHGGDPIKWEGKIDSQVDDWHTYQLWWTPDSLKLGVDGGINDAHLTYNKPSGASNSNWPYDDPMNIIMNVAIGGTLGGDEYVPSGSFNYEMYVDYVRVYQAPPVPTEGPVAPDEPENGVVALLSDTYTVDTTSNWRTDDSVNSAVSDLSLASNTVKKYSNVTQFTIEPSVSLDVSDAYKFQFSIYRTDPYADLKIKLVDFGADDTSDESSNTEHEIIFSQANGNAIGSGQWVPVEILMTDLTGLSSRGAIGQIVVSSHTTVDGIEVGSAETIYLDEMFFSPPPAPTTGPPVAPDEASRNVLSLFGTGFTDVAGLTWTAGSGTVSDSIETGNTIKKAEGGSLAVTATNALGLSGMETLQLDVWRTDETAELQLTLVHTDGGEHSIILSEANGYPVPTVGQWTHFDVPLEVFSGLSSGSSINQVILSSHAGSENSGETLYLDDLFFSKPAANVEITFDAGSYALTSGFVLDQDTGLELGNNVGGTAATQFSFFFPTGGSGSHIAKLSKSAGLDGVGASLATLDSGEFMTTDGSASARIYTAGSDVNVTLTLEDVTGGQTVEFVTTTAASQANQWQTISWDISAIDHTPNYDRAKIYFDAVDPAVTENYYVDDVQFY